MFEIFFILMIIYVAYIIYSAPKDNEQATKPANEIIVDKITPPVTSSSPSKEVSKPAVKSPPAPVVAKAKPAIATKKTAKASQSKAQKKAAPKVELRTVEMKNPKTGEQAKIASNYRMVKRWVKEALVEEGLLDKIYKTNEMDDAAKAKVAEALSIIKAMDKYKV